MSSAEKQRVGTLKIRGVLIALATMIGAVALPAQAEPVTTIGVVIPVVADMGDGGFLSAEELGNETAEGGGWARITDTALQNGFTLAIDTRILSSIEALAGDAPDSATSWRDRVLASQPLLLPWGNVDPWAIPTTSSESFTAAKLGEAVGVDGTELVAWPTGDVVDDTSVSNTIQRGFSRILAFDDVMGGGISRHASDVIADAVSPGATESPAIAARRAVNSLSKSTNIAFPETSEQLTVDRAIALMQELASVGPAIVPVAPLPVNAARVPLVERPLPEAAAELLSLFEADEAEVSNIALDVPAFMRPRVREFVATLDRLGTDEFDASVSAFGTNNDWIDSLVSISLASEYTVLSNTAEIPVSVSNASDSAVTVSVALRSTSGIVQVDSTRQVVTIEPQSNVRITVPMTAVANGRTTLVAKLYDQSGERIGPAVRFPVDVNAQWELVTVIVFFGTVVIIMTVGVIRTIRRRRAAA